MESFVALMAMIAAATLDPGVYFAINTKLPIDQIASGAQAMGGLAFPVTAQQMQALAAEVHEKALLGRVGGAPTLAVGIAKILANSPIGAGLTAIWYHFAIVFEARFILTTIDTGTRVGRFMIQDLGGHFWRPFGRTSWYPSVLISSGLIVGMWGYLLYVGVNDPSGGIKSLWTLFGIANQMLAAVALSTATTILIKMGRARYAWVPAAPMAWLVITTFAAAWQRIFHADPRIGFLAKANATEAKIAAGQVAANKLAAAHSVVFNSRLDAAIGLVLVAVFALIVIESVRQWYLLLSGKKTARLAEEPRVPSRLTASGVFAGSSE